MSEVPESVQPDLSPENPEPATPQVPTPSDKSEKPEKYAALRAQMLNSQNQTGTIAEALGRRSFILALGWVGIIAIGVIGEQVKTRWEYAQVESKNKQTADLDAGEQEEVATPSGLHYADIKVGAGASPQLGDLCLVQYTLRLADGTKVISSHDRGQRALAFQLGTSVARPDLIPPGLDEGISTMHQGGKRRLWVPAALGFGDLPHRFPTMTVEPGSDLVYEVELVKVSLSPA
jgi:FKBP-type peptidyl-prolyl cis-trans isomerase